MVGGVPRLRLTRAMMNMTLSKAKRIKSSNAPKVPEMRISAMQFESPRPVQTWLSVPRAALPPGTPTSGLSACKDPWQPGLQRR